MAFAIIAHYTYMNRIALLLQQRQRWQKESCKKEVGTQIGAPDVF